MFFIYLFIYFFFIDLFTKDEGEYRQSPSRFVFFLSYCSSTSFLTYIISLSAAYLAQVYVQMVEYAIKKVYTKVIFLEKGPKVSFGKK